MEKEKLRIPFFIFNPKSYLYGEQLVEMAKIAEKLANEYDDMSIIITGPFADLFKLSEVTKKVIVSAQHMDGIGPGRGMGHVLPESIKNAGAEATFLNHAERPLSFDELVKSVNRANEMGLITIVCANSLQEARAIATLQPDIILCEPTELIGTGKTSDSEYILNTNRAIKKISPNTLIMQAAGISTADDVYNILQLGADGTGCTSGITNAENPKKMLKDMIEAAYKAKS